MIVPFCFILCIASMVAGQSMSLEATEIADIMPIMPGIKSTRQPAGKSTEGPIQATESPIQPTESPIRATETPTRATESPIQAKEDLVQLATEGPIQATTEGPIQATTEGPIQATDGPMNQTTEGPIGFDTDSDEDDDSKNPNKLAYATCKQMRPQATHVMGQDFECRIKCSGDLGMGLNTYPFDEDVLKDDFTICANGKVCLSGACISQEDVDICKDTLTNTQTLVDMVVDECQVGCKTQGSNILYIDVAKPLGTKCVTDDDKNGSCNEEGQCLPIRFSKY